MRGTTGLIPWILLTTAWYPSVLPMQQRRGFCYFKHPVHLLASLQTWVGKSCCTVPLRKLEAGPRVGGWAQLLVVPTPRTGKSGAGEVGQKNTPRKCHVMELTLHDRGVQKQFQKQAPENKIYRRLSRNLRQTFQRWSLMIVSSFLGRLAGDPFYASFCASFCL